MPYTTFTCKILLSCWHVVPRDVAGDFPTTIYIFFFDADTPYEIQDYLYLSTGDGCMWCVTAICDSTVYHFTLFEKVS